VRWCLSYEIDVGLGRGSLPLALHELREAYLGFARLGKKLDFSSALLVRYGMVFLFVWQECAFLLACSAWKASDDGYFQWEMY